MATRPCGSTMTRSGAPCRNEVDVRLAHCESGHRCVGVAPATSVGAAVNDDFIDYASEPLPLRLRDGVTAACIDCGEVPDSFCVVPLQSAPCPRPPALHSHPSGHWVCWDAGIAQRVGHHRALWTCAAGHVTVGEDAGVLCRSCDTPFLDEAV